MSKFNKSEVLRWVYIIISLVIVVTLFVNVSVVFVKAWFTDNATEYNDSKVAQVDIRILENGTEIGGKTTINHNDSFTQEDDVYTFTPGKTPVYATPNIGSSITLNLQVQNKGWAGGLVRIIGFTIYYLEENHTGETNKLPIFESEATINNNSEVWVSQYVDDVFNSGDPATTPIAYNWYLNRVLQENETADVVVSLTNNSIDTSTYPQLYVSFVAEITVYESNAYKTGGNNPPFGSLSQIPSGWTAWQ